METLGAHYGVAGALVGQSPALLAEQCGQSAGLERCVSMPVCPPDGGEVDPVGKRVSGVLRHAPVLVLRDPAPRAVMTEADSHWSRLPSLGPQVWACPSMRGDAHASQVQTISLVMFKGSRLLSMERST